MPRHCIRSQARSICHFIVFGSVGEAMLAIVCMVKIGFIAVLMLKQEGKLYRTRGVILAALSSVW